MRKGTNVYRGEVDQWLTMGNLTVHRVKSIAGETIWRLDGEHGFHVCPPIETFTAAGIDSSPMRDVRWRPKSVGYLPPDLTLNGVALTPADVTFVRMPDRIFREAAKDVADLGSIDFRWLSDLEDPVAVSLIETLDRAAQEMDIAHWPLLTDSIGTALAVRMLQNLGAAPKPVPAGTMGLKIKRVTEYIEANLEQPLRLEELAGVAAMSTFHFSRSFRRATGMSPVRYVWLRRVERAKEALRDPRATLASVAAMCGFSSQSHFSSLFKKETGITPRRFRDSVLGALLGWFSLKWFGVVDTVALALA